MFTMVNGLQNYSEQAIQAARYIGQGFIVTLDHMNCLCMTIQYSYEKLIPSKKIRGHIHFEFDKCIAYKVCVHVCFINLPIVDWKLRKNKRKKQLKSYSIDFGICVFCGNCVEYCPMNCLLMIEEYELSIYDGHEFNYDQIDLGCLPISIIEDFTIHIISSLIHLTKGIMEGHSNSRSITKNLD
jgi:NADH-plastoquinone oxidoreductase subunit I protein